MNSLDAAPKVPTLFALALAVATLRPVSAQTVWNVTSPTGIQAAIAAASPGDVLVLTAGNGFPDYEPFTLNKGITIRGNGARIGPSQAWPGYQITIAIPAGQVAHIDQIDCSYGIGQTTVGGCPVAVTSGSVRFDRCVMRALTATLTITGGNVVLQSSTLTTVSTWHPASSLAVSGGSVTLRDCQVQGSDGGCHPQTCGFQLQAHTAVTVANATLHAERTTFRGGNQLATQFTANGARGIDATNSVLRLANCTVIAGGSANGNGATALVNNSATAAELRQTALQPGAPGGSASVGPVNLAAPLLALELQPVWTRGQTSILTALGVPNAPHGLWLVTAPSPVVSPFVVEPVWSSGALPIGLGTLSGNGQASHIVAVPAVAALQDTPVWCQGVSGVALPLRASTIAGGIVR